MKKFFSIAVLLLSIITSVQAQQYLGMTGLVHTPTAEMNNQGDARIGAHFLSKEMTPNAGVFYHDGQKYNTGNFYLSITPFKWVELAYDVTLMRRIHYKYTHEHLDNDGYKGSGFHEKDQYLSVKINPLQEKEGKWWPAIAIGGTDFWDSHNGSEMYFGNAYVALTKTLKLGKKKNELAIHLAYRHYFRDYNSKWSKPVGGLTFRPAFYRPLRFIAEWTGKDVIVGADCLLWNHCLVQASLQNGRYPSAGLCYQVNLFGNNKYKNRKNKNKEQYENNDN